MAGWWMPCAGLQPIRWGRLVGGAALVVWLLSISPARSREPGRGPPSDTGPPVRVPAKPSAPAPGRSLDSNAPSSPSVTADSGQIDSGSLEQWHTNLIRERFVEVRLRTIQRDLSEGRLVGALTGL